MNSHRAGFATVRDGAVQELVLVAMIMVLGVVCGVAAKVADESQVRWAADLGTYPAAWVLALAVVARLAPTMIRAAAQTAAFFTFMCLAYYGWSWFVLDFDFDHTFYLWMGLSVTAVPAIGAMVNWACTRQGSLPGLALATVAAVTVADRLLWQLWWAWVLDAAPEEFPLRPVQALVGVSVAVIVVGILPRYTRTRLWAVALIVPMVLVVDGVISWATSFSLQFV